MLAEKVDWKIISFVIFSNFTWIDAKSVYIPPLSRTSGVIKWFLHNDTMCSYDAQKHCEDLYTNGRLIVMESEGIVDTYNEKINKLTNPRYYPTVGLYGSGNATHGEQTWITCEGLNPSFGKIAVSEKYQCYRFFGSRGIIFYGSARFGLSNCSYPSPYVCEEITTEQACDMDEILRTSIGTPKEEFTQAECDAKCRNLHNCWGTLFKDKVCLLMKNTADGVTGTVIMKRKNCVKGLLQTSVVDYTESCVATSPACSQSFSTYQIPEWTPTFSTSTSHPLQATPDVSMSCPDQKTIITNHVTDLQTQTVTVNETQTLINEKTTETVTVMVTQTLVETVTRSESGSSDSCTPNTHFITQPVTETITLSRLTQNHSDICTPVVNYTKEALEKKIEEMVTKLKVDKSNTSAKLRTLVCAKDERPSAQTVGVFGMIFMIVPFAAMLLGDLPEFVSALRELFRHKQ